MEPRIRRATRADVDSLVAVKRALMIPPGTEALSHGGFLLGSSREQYEFFVENANVLVLEAREAEGADARLLGFAVTLPDPLLRKSELWARAAAIEWAPDGITTGMPDLAEILASRIGYFEQLAFLRFPGVRMYAPAFALAAALDLAETGHQHIFMTVVSAPIANLAPLPFLRILGAERIGRIAEEYPEVGRITSDLYHLDTRRWNYGVGADSPLFRLRERVTQTLTTLRNRPAIR